MLTLMRLATLCAALALVLVSGCASTPLHVERYRGAYSTHFEGIPDRAEACAVVRNAGPDGNGVEIIHMHGDDRDKLRKLVQRGLKA